MRLTNAMHVLFNATAVLRRKFVVDLVDHMQNIAHVKSSGAKGGSDEDRVLATPKNDA
jgi:hypothetical protein